MGNRWIVIVVLCGTLLPGCGLLESTRTAARQVFSPFSPEPEQDPGTAEDWEWVGNHATIYRPRERDPDPWSRYFQSDKAREIERNLGID